jgi:hypothetical protein
MWVAVATPSPTWSTLQNGLGIKTLVGRHAKDKDVEAIDTLLGYVCVYVHTINSCSNDTPRMVNFSIKDRKATEIIGIFLSLP